MTFDYNLFCSRGQTPPTLSGHSAGEGQNLKILCKGVLQTLPSAATCDIVPARAFQNEQQK